MHLLDEARYLLLKEIIFNGNIIIEINNNAKDKEFVNTNASHLVNSDLNNQDLCNTTSIPPTNNIYSRPHGVQNLFKFYQGNIYGLKYKSNELLRFLCPALPHII